MGRAGDGNGGVTMNGILTPSHERNNRRSALGVLLLLAFSAAALSVAPAMMPEGYSWIVHTTSESAAQNLESAWVARFGFLSFGMAVMCLATAAENTWARGVVWMHLSFGVLMISINLRQVMEMLTVEVQESVVPMSEAEPRPPEESVDLLARGWRCIPALLGQST